MGVGGQCHALAALPPGRRPSIHCIGGWVGLRAGLEGCGKSRPPGIWSPDCPARSELLYRLHYPGSPYTYVHLYTCMCVSIPPSLLFMFIHPFLNFIIEHNLIYKTTKQQTVQKIRKWTYRFTGILFSL